MRIALISDIHGNALALEAVLSDLNGRGAPDAYWILGDLVAIGPEPVRVLERLATLPDARFIRGNTDRYTVSGERPAPGRAEVRLNPDLLDTALEIEGDFAWALGAVTVSGWLDWLAALPLDFQATLPDGTPVLCVHAAPGTDDGSGILPGDPLDQLGERLAGCPARLVCVGHTHQPFSFQFRDWQVLNPGSLSNPPGADKRASYAILTANETGYRVEHLRVDYDRAAFIAHVQRIRHPAAGLLTRAFGG